MTSLTTPDAIRSYRMKVQRSMLKLESMGMRKRGTSAASQIKREYGFRGNKQSLLQQMDAMIANAQDAEYPDLASEDAGA